MALQEIKKTKQGMSYSLKEKTIILNVLKYFTSEHPDKSVSELVRRTSEATGCSVKSVYQFRKEERSPEGLKQPSRTRERKFICINSSYIKYDESVRLAIRNIIRDMKRSTGTGTLTPSFGNILKQIHLDASLPKFSLNTLKRLLFEMGFYYGKNGKKFELLEPEPDDKTDEEKFKDDSSINTCNVTECNHKKKHHQEDEDKEICGNSDEEIITEVNNTLTIERKPKQI